MFFTSEGLGPPRVWGYRDPLTPTDYYSLVIHLTGVLSLTFGGRTILWESCHGGGGGVVVSSVPGLTHEKGTVTRQGSSGLLLEG